MLKMLHIEYEIIFDRVIISLNKNIKHYEQN